MIKPVTFDEIKEFMKDWVPPKEVKSGYLESGHPYTIVDGMMMVDYMSYDQYLHQKKMENPEYREQMLKFTEELKEVSKKFNLPILTATQKPSK